jgi:flagellar hook-associated protein 1
LINVRVQDQADGTVTVYSGGDYLVAGGVSRPVEVVNEGNRGLSAAYLDIAGINSRLDPSGGQLHGLLASRDDVLGGFLDQLNNFAGTLANEFNKVYSSGQGLTGYADLTSQAAVNDAGAPLDAAGLTLTPANGSFQVLVHDKGADVTHTTDVQVKLDGSGVDKKTTLDDLAAQLNRIDGLSARVTDNGHLTIQSTSASDEFAFAGDTSGVLAAMGINTFFTGSNASDLDVNPVVRADPAKFAASQSGIGVDTNNAVRLAAFPDQAIPSRNGSSISTIYGEIVDGVTQDSSQAQAAADAASAFQQTLQGREQAASGVSIDDEAIQMITFQQSFQAAARFISTLSSLLDVLVKM